MLIKAVTQAILAYAISVIRLPWGVYDELQRNSLFSTGEQ